MQVKIPAAAETESVLELLASLPLFASVEPAELEWLETRGLVVTHGVGTLVRTAGSRVDDMLILVRGRMALYAVKGGGLHKIAEARAGEVVGAIPYSRMQEAPGNLVVEEDLLGFSLDRKHFPELVRECPQVTTALVHHMIDRARGFRAAQLDEDRLQSLSRFASGLAHEINNPAAAAKRDARHLTTVLLEAERKAAALATLRPDDAQMRAIETVRAKCLALTPAPGGIELTQREDELYAWLEGHRMGSVSPDPLAETELRTSDLDLLARELPEIALRTTIEWIVLSVEARTTVRQIESATQRIHDLVEAVKGFTFMDRQEVAEAVDIHRGLQDTLAVLEAKARAKSLQIHLDVAGDPPRVHGFGSELNQVWQRLVDNAIDAAGRGGSVSIAALTRADDVVVSVTDDGQGILPEHRSRIFDPFFTTKPVGSGTGLGLDFARRIVHLHHGDIDFESEPGRTVFRVRLPIAEATTSR